jgi:hypothetical protein
MKPGEILSAAAQIAVALAGFTGAFYTGGKHEQTS